MACLGGRGESRTGSKLRCMIIFTSLKMSDSSDFLPFTVPFFPFLPPVQLTEPLSEPHMHGARTVLEWHTNGGSKLQLDPVPTTQPCSTSLTCLSSARDNNACIFALKPGTLSRELSCACWATLAGMRLYHRPPSAAGAVSAAMAFWKLSSRKVLRSSTMRYRPSPPEGNRKCCSGVGR